MGTGSPAFLAKAYQAVRHRCSKTLANKVYLKFMINPDTKRIPDAFSLLSTSCAVAFACHHGPGRSAVAGRVRESTPRCGRTVRTAPSPSSSCLCIFREPVGTTQNLVCTCLLPQPHSCQHPLHLFQWRRLMLRAIRFRESSQNSGLGRCLQLSHCENR